MTCSTGNNKFLVSVAKAMAYDTTCAGKQLIFVADTLMNSTISQAIQSSQVYGGPGSRLLFEYDYQKEITVSLEDAAFSPTYLALQNGTKLKQEQSAVYRRETVLLDPNGTTTVKGLPTGEVQIVLPDGTFTTVLATGSAITVPTLADTEVDVIYTEDKLVKVLSIDSSTFPKTMELVLSIDIFDSNNKKVEEMQIVVPRFKPDGNFEMSLTHDGVATSSVTGKAMDACGKYADIKFIPVEGTGASCTVTDLLVIPNPVNLDSTAVGDTVQLVVRPLFSDGSTGAPLTPNAVTYLSGDDDIATVDVNGSVAIGATGVQGNATNITITYPLSTGTPVVVPVKIL